MSRFLLLLLSLFVFVIPSGAATAPVAPAAPVAVESVSHNPLPKLRKGGLKAKLVKQYLMKRLRMADGEPTERQKKQGKLALIFGVSSLVLLLIPYVGLLALPAAIAGLVLGVKSVKGNSNAQGLIGLIAGSVTILLFLIALVYIASFGGFF